MVKDTLDCLGLFSLCILSSSVSHYFMLSSYSCNFFFHLQLQLSFFVIFFSVHPLLLCSFFFLVFMFFIGVFRVHLPWRCTFSLAYFYSLVNTLCRWATLIHLFQLFPLFCIPLFPLYLLSLLLYFSSSFLKKKDNDNKRRK